MLLEAGNEAMLAGDRDGALQYWRRSFRCGRAQQRQLIHMLIERVPLAFICDNFEPDLAAYRLLYARGREVSPPDQMQALLERYADLARREAQGADGPPAARPWLEAHWLQTELGDGARALESAQQAVACDPSSFHAHYALGKSLLGQQQFGQAEQCLNWCLQRRPADRGVQKCLEKAVKGRITAVEEEPREKTPTRTAGSRPDLFRLWRSPPPRIRSNDEAHRQGKTQK